MKNWNWKKIANYLAALILALTGGAGGAALYNSAGQEAQEPPAEYGAEAEMDDAEWPDGKAYEFTCSFYRTFRIANFNPVEDALGVHTVYTSGTADALIAAAFEEATGYAGAKVKKRISARRRVPGKGAEEMPAQEDE